MPFFKNTLFVPASNRPIYQQLYDYLRAAILAGQLKSGTRLPSTRALADELGVSRNTVLSAYDQLFAEGYLAAVGGKGTFVTHTLPEALLLPGKARRGMQPPVKRSHALSERAGTLLATPTMPSSPFAQRTNQAFETGIPALNQFPYEIWAKLLSRHAYELHPTRLMYQHVASYGPCARRLPIMSFSPARFGVRWSKSSSSVVRRAGCIWRRAYCSTQVTTCGSKTPVTWGRGGRCWRLGRDWFPYQWTATV